MAPSFDYAVSSLLCVEEEDYSVFYDDNNNTNNNNDDDDDGYIVEEWQQREKHGLDLDLDNSGKDFSDSELGIQSEEILKCLIEKECHFLPKVDYLKRLRNMDLDLDFDSLFRKEALDRIFKVHDHFGFGPRCAYLSINYLDRFLSAYELPKGKAWTMQLLAVACLSLAAKFDETELPDSLDLQVGESKLVFEARTIKRMELLVLSTLSWRMHAVTPFSFIDSFINKINDDQTPPRSLISQSIQLIIGLIKGIDFLEFKPSEIAAAVAIAVVGATKAVDTEHAISVLSQYTLKEKVKECIKLIQDSSLLDGSMNGQMSGGGGAALLSVPQSPIGVLDVECLSYKSDDTTLVPYSNSTNNTPDNKRRKLNTP